MDDLSADLGKPDSAARSLDLSAQSNRKPRREKTFTGCWDCRSRKVKCDEATPECGPCRKRGFPCSGYEPLFVWVTQNSKTYEPGRRRIIRSDLTWLGHHIYDTSTVNKMIDECDSFSKSVGPFGVFCYTTRTLSSPRMALSDTLMAFRDLCQGELAENASYLFHHYTSHVALDMMPFEDARNPWISLYPSMARSATSKGRKSLFYAILAQAAGNLACMGYKVEKMSILATKYYGRAIEELRQTLYEEEDFSVVLGSMLTLIMAEVYSGTSSAWRVHLNGAWEFIAAHQKDAPWKRSEEAWLTAQSLCLLKIRSGTISSPTPLTSESTSLLSSVAFRPDFGFTTGATPELMYCITSTTLLAQQLSQNSVENLETAISELHHRLRNSESPSPSSPPDSLINLHRRIFRGGALVYFHRSVYSSPPSRLLLLLDMIFSGVMQYQELGGGYITLWPIFIASVEAYREDHKVMVRKWLDVAERIGSASRKDVRKVIESVWRKRTDVAEKSGFEIDEGDIKVDWREVMRSQNLDLLLV